MAVQRKRIVVVGAGYAGMLATLRLAGKVRDLPVHITLVNESDTFVERVRLHQVAAGQTFAQRPLASLLQGTGVEFVRARVAHIDAARHELVASADAGEVRLSYDKLVYAPGSSTDVQRVPGVREHAYVLAPAGPRSALALHERLPALDAAQGTLLVCGAGATGIEAAAEIAGSFPRLRVTLLTRADFAGFIQGKAVDYMRHSLQQLGVRIQEHTPIRQVQSGAVITAAGEALSFDLCLWTGGFSAPALAREAGLAVNERGQMLIDPYMRSLTSPDIYGAGDAAQPLEEPGAPMRMAAATATILGAHCADCLSAVLHGRSAKPLSFAYAGQGIALGRHDAIGFGKTADDVARGPYFTGRAGLAIRETFVKLLATLPSLEKRFPGIFTWPGKGRYAAAKRQASVKQQATPA